MLAKNILLEAYTNPCTMEELSIALGVASPYLEEAVNKLETGLLLHKTQDNKYETDFIILDKEIQKKIFDNTLEAAKTLCPKLMFFAGTGLDSILLIETMSAKSAVEHSSKIARKYTDDFQKENLNEEIDNFKEVNSKNSDLKDELQIELTDIVKNWKTKYNNKSTLGTISSDLAMWFYLFKTIRDIIFETAINKNIKTDYLKKYKGQWTLTGFEEYNDNELLKYNIKMDWDYDPGRMDRHLFKFYFNGKDDAKPTLKECEFLGDVLKNEKTFNILSQTEKDIINDLVKRELVSIENEIIKPYFPVTFTAGLNEFSNTLLEKISLNELKALGLKASSATEIIIKSCYEEINKLYEYNLVQIKEGLPARLGEQAKYCARDMLSYLNNAVLKYATENNYLENTDKPIGIGLYVTN